MGFDFDYYWQRIKDGDERILEKLFKETYATLCSYSRQITHDSRLSEEIVQDVFQKIWQDREIISIHSSFKSYLFQSVRNYSINERKKKSTGKSQVNQTAPDELWNYILNHSQSDEYIIEKITSSDTAKIIENAFETLPPQCRIVFQFSRLDNKSNNEIAALLNISVNTVRAHIFNALSKISELLGKGR